jgi:hypothetical protein
MHFRASRIAYLGVVIVALLSGSVINASDAGANSNNKKPPNRVYYLPGFKILIKPKPAPEPQRHPVDDVIIVRPVPLW